MSKKFITHYLRDSEDNDQGELLSQIKAQPCPTHIKIRKLQGLREQLKQIMLRLGQLDQPRKDLTESTCLTEMSEYNEQQELWQHIDHLEEQIMRARQTKIQLNEMIEYYEEEMIELEDIHQSKRIFNEELTDKLQRKRKKVECNKSWTFQTEKLHKNLEEAKTYLRESIRHLWA